ncbi:restriction endonuclease subunit S [Erwinia pyrifoliae]|uniref:restriction endonuclease subunit S n=1 Tax=Erwinia pyrifoliae TaxID=79967 RepID=UPI00220C8BE5|nr:restriction endonuclease subunit S [Erwinia pyrifoliae]UWS28801.1 restriction endonuclease subunit S [Erwinia pyrifoliae]
MSSDWSFVRLGDHCLKIGSGATPKGGKSVYLDNGKTSLIRSQNIYNDGFKNSGLAYITEDAAKKLNNVEVQDGDILLNITGDSVARVCLAPEGHLPARVNQHVAIIRPNSKEFDARFIRYFLASPAQQNVLLTIASAGATRNALTKSNIESLLICKPCLKNQKWIADQLESLDKKIHSNQQINQTLEQMAQALFKSWFVDFEPVKAKIALLEAGGSQQEATLAAMTAISGKDADSLEVFKHKQPEKFAELKATAELFPSAMQESELGEIPQGWTNSEIGEEIDIAGGATPSTKEPKFWENGDINWTTPKDLSNLQDKILIKTDRKITDRGLAKISSGLLAIDTVLMSSRAPVGYLALTKIPVAINQGYIAMKCNYDLSPEFVLQWCNHNMPEIISRASGTTFAEISKKNFNPIPLIKPTKKMVDIYTREVRSLYLLIEKNVRKTEILQQLRDTLLPKLLSGEITLPQAEQAPSE